MNLPISIPHLIICPYCQKESKLEWQKSSFYEILVYYCHECKSGFTTTESDTISLKKYNLKKRSILRKDIIKKIYK